MLKILDYPKSQYKRWNSYKFSKKKLQPNLYRFLELLEDILICIFFVLIIRHFILQVSVIPSPSMVPTLNVGDRLFVNKYIYRFNLPKRKDIIVFKSPMKDKKHYVKRCIGLPGEVIQIKKVFVHIKTI